jgi:DNA polymerase
MGRTEESPLGDVAAALKAWVEYQRAMGLEELTKLPDEECLYQAPPPVSAAELTATEPTASEGEPPRAESPAPAEQAPQLTLATLEQSLQGCERCPLHRQRHTIVFGTGSPRATLAFVGEGPGRDEDRQGEPFVGAAGQLLTRIIQAIGLKREEVYICNVVKCRPPGNRTPEPIEQETCGSFLDQQLSLIAPQVIVALGATAANYLLETQRPLRQLRGRFHDFPRGTAMVMPTYHPAYLLRTPAAKRQVWEDMKKVRDRLGLKS